MTANKNCGRRAFVRYKGGVSGESPVDDRSMGDPVEVVLGAGNLPRGLDRAFSDMEVGEIRSVVVPPEDGFGLHDPRGVSAYPRVFIDGGSRLRKGDVFAWTNPVSGMAVPVKCVDADETSVVIDFNHPFAGKELTYRLELVSLD